MSGTGRGWVRGRGWALGETGLTHRWLAIVIVALLAAALPVREAVVAPADAGRLAAQRSACLAPRWVGGWSASPQLTSAKGSSAFASTSAIAGGAVTRPVPVFVDQTLRMVVAPLAAGTGLRLRFSNRFGGASVKFDGVHVGYRSVGAGVAEGTNVPVTFGGGAASVNLAPRTSVLSDPVTMAVSPLDPLVVSFHVPGPASLDMHIDSLTTSYLTPPGSGSRGAEVAGDVFSIATTYWFGLTGIDVMAPQPTGVVVALGDSLTDGNGSTVDANRRWPDFLARRVGAPNAAARPLAVLNAGISGNQLARSSDSSPAALDRLAADALSQTGVTDVILFEGINDIGAFGLHGRRVAPLAPADDLARPVIDGYRRIISRAHQAGVRIVGATLTPVGLTGAAETARRIVNQWIRNSDAFDAVADFDAAVRDPANRSRLATRYATSDGIHLNDAGAKVVAGAVPVAALGVRCG